MNHISTISIYEGSYQISRTKTHLVITDEFIADEFAKLNSYRKSDKYWIEVEQDGVATRHIVNSASA